MAIENSEAPENVKGDQVIEEAADKLAAPNAQEERDDDWSPDDLSPNQREQYDTAVKAVDQFIENHPTYKATDQNQQAILDYLESHDLLISPASLELAWEQIGDRLDLADQPEAVPPKSKDEDASVRLATAGLARGKRNEDEPPESDESEPALPQEEISKRGKPVAWRNGRRLGVGG